MATAVSSYNDIQLETIQEVSCSTSCSSNSTTSSSSNSPTSQNKISPGYRNKQQQLHKKGQKIGNYLLGKTIGSGTSSKVKIGTNINTGKQYAIKITKPKRIKERKEIEREISILKRLKHDNIIQLHDAIYEDEAGRICLILELVSGGELFDYIVARGRLSEKEGRKFFRQMLCGLIYCHSNMVCHRDLKLENLLVDEDGNLKISDFGYSNIIKPGNLLSTFCGSPVYAPPEILLEKRYNGNEVDIWSMGVILYAMVTGQLPWTLTDGVQVEGMDRLLRGEFKYPSHVILSDDVKDLINRMIVAEPVERATLDEIKNHVWVNKGYDMEPDQEYNKKVSDRLEKEQQQLLEKQQAQLQQQLNSPRSPKPLFVETIIGNSRPLNQSSPNLTIPQNKSILNINNNNNNNNNNSSNINQIKPIHFNSVACLDEKKINSSAPTSPHSISPQYASPQFISPSPSTSTTPPLSPLSVSGQRSPPTFSSNTNNNNIPNNHNSLSSSQNNINTSGVKNHHSTSLFHNIFKKRQSISSVSANSSPVIVSSNSGQNNTLNVSSNSINVDGASASAPQFSSSSSKRRFSLEDIVKAITIRSGKGKNPKIRSMKGPFNSGTTTMLNPIQLIEHIEENLNSTQISYRRNFYVFDCKTLCPRNETINFEIEVCKVNGMDMYGIKFKRLAGDAWSYSSSCIKIVESLKL
ncbi:hypothetical protein RB653_000598 [Dictyostelium firmibasis]|uniref:non-specific serine/threonine protein kinase n=1 Tax=Dictyostelium firmibasis TaxID=79012 RepID=A0AAN7UFK1_9MYCE